MTTRERTTVAKTANSERLRQIRELREWTQEELAERLGVEQSFVANVEAGRRPAPDSFVEGMAMQAGFPLGYFYRDTPPEFPLGSLLFRAPSAVGSRERNRARRFAQVIFECADAMLGKLTGLPLRLPRLPQGDVERATQHTRSALGLSPDTPIHRLIRSVERAGVLVLVLPQPDSRVDAFSGWAGSDPQRPVIVLAANRPPDRMRMTIAHELAHLVLHQAAATGIGSVEAEANRFAEEFLMPAARMKEEMSTPMTLSTLAALKARWGVSIQALIRRAHSLGAITSRQYRYLFEQVNARGWRVREPDSAALPVEHPRGFREMAELLYGIPVDTTKMAKAMDLRVRQVDAILKGYAGRSGTVAPSRNGAPRGRVLQLKMQRPADST